MTDPLRCRLFGHRWRNQFGWPVPDFYLPSAEGSLGGGSSLDLLYTCLRCGEKAFLGDFLPKTATAEKWVRPDPGRRDG